MKVLVTAEIDEAGVARLRDQGHEVDVFEGEGPISREELLRRVEGCAGLLCMLTDPVDGAVLDAGPVRAVAQHAVGFDNLDLEAARARGVVVTNTPGTLTDATADLAFALLLCAARRVTEGDRLVRAGRFLGWKPQMLCGLELRGATLGIVGWGRIGQAMARRAEAFGLRVRWSSRSGGEPLAVLLAESDVVSLHCPLTPQTRHLLGRAELRSMRPHAVLINTARGPVVDEEALVVALREGWIGAAGLDVYEEEPVVHPGLLELDNVVLLPHLGSATVACRRTMALQAADNLVAALAGETPPDRIA